MESASPVRGQGRLAGIAGLFAGLILLLFFLQGSLLPKVILGYVESALELKVTGNVRPVWGKFEFSVEPIQTLWDEKIKINSGRVNVRYGFEKSWAGPLHLIVSGENVDAELLGDWVSVAGGTAAVFKHLYADLIIDHEGIQEIRALRAESPTLQFRFGEASNRHLKESHEA